MDQAIQIRHRYIMTNDKILSGEPIIEGTRTPVRAIVETWRMGVPAEEIPRRLPHLSLAQVFDALSYYSDHQEEINTYIERNRIPDETNNCRSSPSPPTRTKIVESIKPFNR